MDPSRTFTTFAGDRHLVTADLPTTLRAAKEWHDDGGDEPILIFNYETGARVDFDLSGSTEDVVERVVPPAPARGPGRPRLGVVSREVSLLPRHWDWLAGQRGGASAALRRLVDEARKNEGPNERARRTADATDRIMTVLAGDLPHHVEARRALAAGDRDLFETLIRDWPEDVRTFLLRRAGRAFAQKA